MGINHTENLLGQVLELRGRLGDHLAQYSASEDPIDPNESLRAARYIVDLLAPDLLTLARERGIDALEIGQIPAEMEERFIDRMVKIACTLENERQVLQNNQKMDFLWSGTALAGGALLAQQVFALGPAILTKLLVAGTLLAVPAMGEKVQSPDLQPSAMLIQNADRLGFLGLAFVAGMSTLLLGSAALSAIESKNYNALRNSLCEGGSNRMWLLFIRHACQKILKFEAGQNLQKKLDAATSSVNSADPVDLKLLMKEAERFVLEENNGPKEPLRRHAAAIYQPVQNSASAGEEPRSQPLKAGVNPS